MTEPTAPDAALIWARNMRALQHRNDTVLVGTLNAGNADHRCAEIAEAYRAGQAHERAAIAWQPIESAPRDGRRFVALIPRKHRQTPYEPSICHWERALQKPRFIFDDWGRGPEPTHWMPLPPPPSDTP